MKHLHKIYDELQLKYGEPSLHAIYGGGCEDNPNVCLVFMNPTAKNIASHKSWTGISRQWLGTKQIWKFLTNCNLFDDSLNKTIQTIKASDWTPELAEKVYQNLAERKIYITNLAKCTQSDAKPLSDKIFKEYLSYLFEELELINPKKIILFGNQVSSIVLGEKISVSACRKQKYDLHIKNNSYSCYRAYYPVGNGFFNVDKAIEDVTFITNLKL
jgi:hypothetical protein